MRNKSQLHSLRLIVLLIVGASLVSFAVIFFLIFRTTYNQGKSQVAMPAVLLILAVCAVAFALYYTLIKLLANPVGRLSADLERLVPDDRVDEKLYAKTQEFHVLCASINGMLDRLSASIRIAEESHSSTEVLKSILNGMNAYIYVSDPETDEILFINDSMLRHFGLDDDLIGQICWQVLQTGFTKRCDFCPMHQLDQNSDEVVTWEEKNTVTGRDYRNTDCLIEWTNKKKVHLQHSVDVTELKKVDASLKLRLEQLEFMSAMSQSFISIEDIATLINNALKMTGSFMGVDHILLCRHNKQTGKGDVIYDWHHDPEKHLTSDDYDIPFAKGAPTYDALAIEEQPFVVCCNVHTDPNYNYLDRTDVRAFIDVPIFTFGALWGFLGVNQCRSTRDWTESDIYLLQLISSVISGVITRNLTEESLVRMSSIVNSSPQYISYINPKGDFEYLNHGASNLTGYTHDELLAGGMALLFDDDTYKRIREEIIPDITREGRKNFELPVIRKGGEERIFSFSAFQTNLKKAGIGAIALDITDRLQLEKELVDAKEQAEQSNQAKSDFLSRMSHEMRTPMNAIIGMTNIAQASRDLGRMDYCLSKIDSASNHLLGVINDVLDMSKIEANKFELSYEEFSVEKMLSQITNVINFRVEEKQQRFVIRLDKNMPGYIISDEQRLSQVIANLLSNAVKFTPDGGLITLCARMLDEDADGVCTLEMKVSDTGIGISPEQQDRLFHSFEQADGGITRKFGGTGLGLVISKNIVKMMGGAIWIESELGEGATFLFTIKAQRGSTQEHIAPVADGKDLRILLVDPLVELREYFLNFAEAHDLFCHVCADAYEALTLTDGPYDLIFLEWKMPGIDGVELASRIRQSGNTEAMIVLISNAEMGDVEEEARAAGVNKFLEKPLFSSAIVDTINQYRQPEVEIEPGATDGEGFDGAFSDNRILLAEDIEINREIVIALLEFTGIAIDCAENGRQALEMFKRNPDAYDLIFMDIHMPELDGLEATRCIRAIGSERAKNIPIVAMTANVFREDIDRCLESGMNDHVGKPIDIAEVLDRLQKYMGGRCSNSTSK